MDKILILDFGSQYTQLIARRVREIGVYCEIHPFHKIPALEEVKGVILSGSPASVNDADAPVPDLGAIRGKFPLLGICYGAQFLSKSAGGRVAPAASREYGRAELSVGEADPLFEGMSARSTVWMSHGDTILSLPAGYRVIASTSDVENAAFRVDGEPTWGIQFHPEVHHSAEGSVLLKNFVGGICGCACDWTAENFVEATVASLKAQLGEDEVILGLSGGVDSSVAALLLHRAVGGRLHCIFVDSGLLRKNEFDEVLASYEGMGLQVEGVRAADRFLKDLAGVTEPERKRKIIGEEFIRVFEEVGKEIGTVDYLAQGTIYPDVVESGTGQAAVIKSHHNVGGLPEEMNLKVVEPLRMLFKDEVRRVGRALGIKEELVGRHPFPGPSLAIRILGDVTEEKLRVLREADDIFIRALRAYDCTGMGFPCAADPRVMATNLYDAIWQAGVILLPVKSVGVMGDERTYENPVALRAVVSTDAMTADWFRFPYDFLADVSNDIINKVRGVNRVVYDISSKPPATIEWE